METTEKKLSKIPLAEIAQRILNSGWNCTSKTGIASIILKRIYPNKNFDELLAFLYKEKERMDKNSSFDFARYYGTDIIELVEILQKGSNNPFGVGLIINGIKSNSEYNKFHWGNFEFLAEENMLSILGDFNTLFRGNLTAVHRVYNNKYIIVESVNLDGNTFYNFKDGNIGHYCYGEFEEALFSQMAGNLSSGMNAIYQYSKTIK